MALKAVLFDMDGVIVDTMNLHSQASRRVFGELGIERKKNLNIHQVAHRTFDAFKNAMPERSDEQIRAIEHKKYDYLEGMASGIDTFLGFREFFAQAKAKYKIALVSNSKKRFIDFILKETGIGNAFGVIVSADDDLPGKPEPDCYLRAAKLLGVKPEECVVIEDSLSGILSAKKAGMKVIAVENTHERNFLLDANLIVRSLKEISIKNAGALFDD